MTHQEAVAKTIEVLDRYEIAYTINQEDGNPNVDIDLDLLKEDGMNALKSAMMEMEAFAHVNDLLP